MAVVRTLLVWVAVAGCWVQHTTGSCPTGKFGDSCFYSCHCGDSCDQTTGVCEVGCDADWVGGHGATCQKDNIAKGKSATSQFGVYRAAWSADKTVDGIRDQVMEHGSCFHSSTIYPSVWTVDLGKPYRIHDVRIYHRTGYIYRLQTAVLTLSNSSSPTTGVTCFTFPNDTAKTNNSVYDVTCDGTGRYFTISHSTETLNLCEVEIYVCSHGTFGELCNHFCHCSDGSCGRFSGNCAGDCRPGWQGQNCSTECDKDQYGVNCNETCGNRKCAAAPSSCDRHTGSNDAGCLPGWTELDCKQECSLGTYGQNCSRQCTQRNCAGNSSCDHVTGKCVTRCKLGWMGIDCIQACDSQHYGANCVKTCTSRHCIGDSSCNTTGHCDTGCLPGWTEVDCKQECSLGTYGQNCSLLCTERNCAGNSSCDHVTGECVTRCKPGWMGIDCIQACEPHRYGPNCDKTCASRHCVGNSSCNSTGHCDSGCETGWTLDDCTACDSQHYGADCVKNCTSRHCVGNSSCNTTGHCDSGCEAGWTPSDCTEAIASTGPDPDDSIPTYIGAAVGVILAGLVLGLIIFIIRRRRQRERKHPNDGLVQRPRMKSKAQSDTGNVYMNVGFAEEKQAQVQTKGSVGKRPSVVTLEEDDDAHATIQQGEAPEIPDRNYYNLDEAGVGHVISVFSLEAKVKEFEELPQLGEGEFKRLPDGFIHPYRESQMPQNNGKNRFKGYYPYDYNRVILQDASDGGDYINASYLDGYKRDRRYVAAQGPYNSQVVVDFWRMIWKEECRTVVMVTGLVEGGKVKCLRYWPEKGTKTYGDVMVTMVSETRLSHYTITKLSVESKKECKKRDVHHLNFTSWPDHGVPDTAALLDFMWRTEAISGQQTEPIVVHCSAGIGRTGTYIAIESLVEQAKSEDVVDVVSFVSNMRGQRKNMIQTKEQYLFVYQAVARAVTEGDTSLDADVLRQMDLDHVSVNFGNRTIQQHLEALRNVHQRNTEGVNVRSVHSYTKRNGFFIMTSHPDKEEVWNQVYNSDSHCLLTFAVGDLSYLPSVDSPITTERFAVSMRSSTALSHDILLNTIDINIKDCDDTTTIQHYHITGSPRDPNISWLIDSFLTWTSDPQRSSSTIISDSVTDCRLLVLLLNIASRLQDDGRVDVINNMRQLYKCLGGPPFTEADVMFCLESAQRRLVSSNVYANF